MGTAADILVVEDERAIASLLRRGLSYEGYAVAIAESGADALDTIREHRPDLVILDIMLPGDIDGLEVCRRLRSAGDDYLVKPFAFEELLARVRALLRRRERHEDAPTEDVVYHFADLTLDTSTRFAYRGERRIDLTTREYDLLLLFMQHPNQVLTRDVIMERVWGYDFPGESNVLEVYISNLRRRLEANGERRLLQTVRGAGYALR